MTQLHIIALTACLFALCGSRSVFANDLPSPARCDLRPIKLPTVEGTLQMTSGVSTAISLNRRLTMQRKRTPAGERYIEFTEDAELAMGKSAIADLMQAVAGSFRGSMGESCQFSVSGFSSGSSPGSPPVWRLDSNGKARLCTRFEYQCGQETRCEIRWDFQKCETWQKFCEARQVVDVGDWSAMANGRFVAAPASNKRDIEITLVTDDKRIETGGSGDVGKLLEDVGLLGMLQNILQFRPPNLNSVPTSFKILDLTTPSNVIAERSVSSVAWAKFNHVNEALYSSIGLRYTQKAATLWRSGCQIARCIRTTKNEDDYAKCVLD